MPAMANPRPDVLETSKYSDTLNMNARQAPNSIMNTDQAATCHDGARNNCGDAATLGPARVVENTTSFIHEEKLMLSSFQQG